jgi:hypothetical protein
MTTLSDEYGKIFAIDSKQHIRQREIDGSLKELFRANIGVVVNPNDIDKFEEDYDSILKKLFDQFEIKKEPSCI